jgi:drug/metabolite transporter (DMT)-like permease
MLQQNKNIAWLMFVLLALVWGSSFILMKRGLLAFTPVQVGLIRVVFASFFTAIIGIRTFKYFRRQDLFPLFIVGWLGNGIPYILFPLAVSRIDSSIVGIANSLVPLFTLIVGLIWFQFKPKLFQIAGITVGFIGAFFLVKPTHGIVLDENSTYIFFAILATIFYAISINTIKSKLQHLNSLAITNLSLVTVSPFMLAVLLFTDFIPIVEHHRYAISSLGYLAILGIIGSSLAIIAFNYLIKLSGALFSSSVTYAIPIVAILWGWIDGEIIGIRHITGVVCILIGIYLVNFRKKSI